MISKTLMITLVILISIGVLVFGLGRVQALDCADGGYTFDIPDQDLDDVVVDVRPIALARRQLARRTVRRPLGVPGPQVDEEAPQVQAHPLVVGGAGRQRGWQIGDDRRL